MKRIDSTTRLRCTVQESEDKSMPEEANKLIKSREDSKLLKIQRETMFPRRQPQTQKSSWRPYVGIALGVFLLYLILWSPFNGSSSAGAKDDLYGIMIDAGSTGSRIHIYRFTVRSDDDYELQSEVFKQLEPGLSSYGSDAQGAADSLDPLLNTALESVPSARHSSTPISLKATAGLRLLEASQSEDILVACRNKLASTPFSFDVSSGVEIMDGSSEGLFGWVTVNYLLRKLVEPAAKTAAVLDLGGGSTQIALSVPGARHLPPTTLLGATHYMYLYSHLGFGIMAGRAALLRHQGGDSHPCIFEGVTASYDYGKESFRVIGRKASFESCLTVAQAVMYDKKGSFAQTNGAPNPTNDQPVVAMSYYYDRAVDSGIIEAGVLEGSLTPKDYEEQGKRVCDLHPEHLKKNAPTIKDGHEHFMCMDLVFIYALLTDGFGLGPDTQLTLAKKIDYNGESVETAWSLGATLRDLSDL